MSDSLLVFTEEHMYMKINKFLLSHEYLNMSKVPGFYQFFYSSDFEVAPCPEVHRAPSLLSGMLSHRANSSLQRLVGYRAYRLGWRVGGRRTCL